MKRRNFRIVHFQHIVPFRLGRRVQRVGKRHVGIEMNDFVRDGRCRRQNPVSDVASSGFGIVDTDQIIARANGRRIGFGNRDALRRRPGVVG